MDKLIPLTAREAEIANTRYVEGWNAAIEAAAKVAEHEGYFNGVEAIRKLKK